MSYRKLKAEYLFDGFVMRKGAVLITGTDGTIETILDEKEAGDEVESLTGILCPGLVNCHCHLELSHMKGLIPERLGLVNFVYAVVSQRNHSEEMKKVAIQKAASAMWSAGIVAVGDICNTADTLGQKLQEINDPTKVMAYFNFIEVFGWAPGLADDRFETGLGLAARFAEAGIPTGRISLSPHAPYSVSDLLWDRLQPNFAGKTITMHNQESEAENEYFRNGTGDFSRMYQLIKVETAHFQPPGSSSLCYVIPRLQYAAKVILVHNTFTGETDIITAEKSLGDRVFFCFCPNANVYIENRLPDIPRFIKSGANLVLGTDSLASTHQLSILEEMKTIKQAFPSISTPELLLWATSNGARALSFDDRLGDFSKGKKPGIVLIEGAVNGEIGVESRSSRLL